MDAKKKEETKEAACRLLKRMQESSSCLTVRYDDGEKPEATVPAELQQYIASCLRVLCADHGRTGRTEQGENCQARRFQLNGQTCSVYIYRNGVVNIYRDRDLIAAADLRKPSGELEEKAFAIYTERLLDSMRIFL